MRKCVTNVEEVKKNIDDLKGALLRISVNKGRKKIVKYNGLIESVFPCVFTLKILDDKNVNTLSFSYTDVICGDIKLKRHLELG